MTDAQIRWGGYPRISEDPKDTRAGVGRQREDIAEAISKRGGDLAAIEWYVENNTSAYKKKRIEVTDPQGRSYMGYRVIRPIWHDALHDLRTGKIKGLMVWDLDRLARDPRDLEDAIEAVEHYGATIASATASEIDLTTETGRMMARFHIIIAQKSSADTARRVRRAHEATAKEGRPVGGFRPFGWQADRQTLDATEARLVREAVDQLIAGGSMRGIAEAWRELGIETTAGKPWKATTLRQYMRNPRLVGIRTYRGAVLNDGSGRPVRGQWEPMVDQDTWDRLQKALERPEQRGRIPRRDARHYLLTGLVRCGICNSPMYGNRYGEHKGEPRFYYVCNAEGVQKHSLGVSGHGTDELIGRLLVGRMARAAAEGPAPSVPEWHGGERIEELEGLIAATLDQLGKGKIAAERIFGQAERLEAELSELRAERNAWIAESTGPAVDVVSAAEWRDMSTDDKRAIAEKWLSAVYIKPAVKQQNRLDENRIEPVWKKRPALRSLVSPQA